MSRHVQQPKPLRTRYPSPLPADAAPGPRVTSPPAPPALALAAPAPPTDSPDVIARSWEGWLE